MLPPFHEAFQGDRCFQDLALIYSESSFKIEAHPLRNR